MLTKVSADVTDTKNDLAATKGKLDHAIGDLNKHSELIATSHDELEMLKHKGDRDYFEFTLKKDKDPDASFDCQPAAQEDRSQEEQIHALRAGR